MYISEMSKANQARIKADLTKALKQAGYKGPELADLVADGMAGKLSDVDDLVNVKRYNKAVRSWKH